MISLSDISFAQLQKALISASKDKSPRDLFYGHLRFSSNFASLYFYESADMWGNIRWVSNMFLNHMHIESGWGN